ncbi:hypothetical protein JCM17823_08440 [Halorubrum gandharaense]
MFVEHFPDRGQAHTLEAFVAALLLVAGLIFATQATAVTPLSASTSNQHIENQQAIGAQDVLTTTKERGDLQAALLLWDSEDGAFFHPEEGRSAPYTSVSDVRDWEEHGVDDHPLDATLTEAFDTRRVAFNVDVYYPDPDPEEGMDQESMFDMGDPSDNAATASTRVALYMDDEFGPDGDRTLGEAIENGESDFFADPSGEGSDTLYTVVEVRITAWQM